jgi:hypothetical protein
MLKRAWLVLCILWTLFLGLIPLYSPDHLDFGFYFLLLAPWLAGLFLFYFWRFVRYGRFTRW